MYSARLLAARALSLSLLTLAAPNALAGNGFTSTGPSGTLGYGVNGHYLSASNNPASIGYDRQFIPENNFTAGRMHLAMGMEYGNVQELFDTYDKLSAYLEDKDDSDDSGSGNGGGNPDQPPKPIDPVNPDLEKLIDEFKQEATRIGALLAIISVEGYANADLDSDFAVLFNRTWAGGTWGMELSLGGSASAIGFIDDIDFDPEQALTELKAAYNLQPGDPATSFDLSGGLLLHIDPNAGTVRGEFDNDSLLAVRAAKKNTLSLSYSYELPLSDDSDSRLFLGLKPKFVNMGLSGVITRIGDIADSEKLFDDIRNASFNETNNLSLDAGLLWQTGNYTLGASVADIFEPTYQFNLVSSGDFSNPELVAQVNRLQNFQKSRQFLIDGSFLSDNRHWSASFSVDANEIKDALGETHQWLHLGGSWRPETRWIPSLRLGYSANLAGTEARIAKLGMSLFRHVDLDVGLSSDTVEISGDTLPRGLFASLGFQYGF